MLHPDHCLHDLFPAKRENHCRLLQTRGHQYTPPIVKSCHKSSSVNRCLFDFIRDFSEVLLLGLVSLLLLVLLSFMV
jgi:hypothetical protein